uniref:Germin-like protein n=1 Tax=Linum usitatissimum TaxID=4006 RepID=Q9ATZ1_LINUS|nr:germin-like protein [Linum usitatissimum]
METKLQLLSLTILFYTQSAHAADFCVADLASRETSTGYPCKSPSNVTVDDFVFKGFTAPLSTSNPNKLSLNRAFVKSFPALNGLDLAAVRVDMERDGVVPLHSHPYSPEMIFIIEGTVTAGFVSGLDSNVAYIKTLNKGEMMVIPQGFLHFQANSGPGNATIFVNFNKADPGVQFITGALFRNSFPTWLLEKTTGISQAEIRDLKNLHGGSG